MTTFKSKDDVLTLLVHLGYLEYDSVNKKVYIPNKDKPTIIVKLKWDKEADTASKQIKAKKYPKVLDNYLDNLLLVGISYNKDTKEHNCIIEKYNNSK